MRIKLRYVIVFVFLVGLVGILPWIDGLLIKRNYQNFLIAISNDNSANAKILNYHMGWLSSDAEVYFSGYLPQQKTSNLGITLKQHISHGPFLFDTTLGQWIFALAEIQTDVHFPQKTETDLLGARAQRGVFNINTIVTFHNKFISEIKMPPATIKVSETSKIITQGFYGKVSTDLVNQRINHIKTDIQAAAISIESIHGSLEIASMSSQGEKSCQSTGLCSGSAKFTIPEVHGKNESGTNVAMKDFSFTTSSDIDSNNLVNGELQVSLNSLIGSNYSIGTSSIKISTGNLNGDSLIEMMNIAKNTEKNANDQNSRAVNLAILAQYDAMLPHLITSNTTINGDALVNSSNGYITSSAKVFWPVNTPLPATMDDLAAKINLQMTARASITLVDKIIEFLDSKPKDSAAMTVKQKFNNLVNQGFFTKEKNDYFVKITYDRGVFGINGKTMPTS